MQPRLIAPSLMLCAALLTACGHQAAPVCPEPVTIPDVLLTCPSGPARPDPVDVVTLTIALAEAETARRVCAGRLERVRGILEGE